MKLLVSLLLLIFDTFLYAHDKPYLLPITRNGVTHTMVAYNFWSGEYPQPVIYIQPGRNNTSKIRGYASLRTPGKKKSCTVKSGIYHPWSKNKISLINYYSIIPIINYVAKNDTILNDQKIKKGDRLGHEVYLAEGSCAYLFNGKIKLETSCIDEDPKFKITKYPSHPSEQWLHLSCKEGYNIFVQDRDLLTQPNVRKGRILGYGEVTEK